MQIFLFNIPGKYVYNAITKWKGANEIEDMGQNDDKTGNEYIINVEHLNKQFLVDKQPIEVLRDMNLKIKKGEFITIVGHSGCGKSTLLKIMCGLVNYEDGVVERNGHAVVGPGPKCGMVFQDHRLMPWLKIKDNVGFGLRHLSKKEEKEQKVKEHLELVGLRDIRKQLSESVIRWYVATGRDSKRACK